MALGGAVDPENPRLANGLPTFNGLGVAQPQSGVAGAPQPAPLAPTTAQTAATSARNAQNSDATIANLTGGGITSLDTSSAMTPAADGGLFAGPDYNVKPLGSPQPYKGPNRFSTNWNSRLGLANAGLIPGKVDPTVADDTTINAKKGEYVIPQEVVGALGTNYLDKLVKSTKGKLGLPTEIGPKMHNQPDSMGRMDKPGLADGGALAERVKKMRGISTTAGNNQTFVKPLLQDQQENTPLTGANARPAAPINTWTGQPITTPAALPVSLGLRSAQAAEIPRAIPANTATAVTPSGYGTPQVQPTLIAAPIAPPPKPNIWAGNSPMVSVKGALSPQAAQGMHDRTDWSAGSKNMLDTARSAKYDEEVARAKAFNTGAPETAAQRLIAIQSGNTTWGLPKAQQEALVASDIKDNSEREKNQTDLGVSGNTLEGTKYTADTGLEGHKYTAKELADSRREYGKDKVEAARLLAESGALARTDLLESRKEESKYKVDTERANRITLAESTAYNAWLKSNPSDEAGAFEAGRAAGALARGQKLIKGALPAVVGTKHPYNPFKADEPDSPFVPAQYSNELPAEVPAGMTRVGSNPSTGKPVYKDAAGNLHS
jgi:hypothetical protein